MIVAITGPRPQSLGNCFRWKDKRRIKIRNYLKTQFDEFIKKNTEEEISFYIGMALGIDQDAFSVLLELREKYTNIKLIAVVPFRNQYKAWKKEDDLSRYFKFLQMADDVVYVDELENTKYYSEPSEDKDKIGKKLKTRNKYMVDKADKLFAYPVENGNKMSGTIQCIEYAKKKKKHIIVTSLCVKK